MATYRMDDETIVKTENATQTWEEDTRWNGSNHISVATGTQFEHQKLYRSSKGRFWIEHTSQWQGSVDRAEWIEDRAAVLWLLANNHVTPADLRALVGEVSE